VGENLCKLRQERLNGGGQNLCKLRKERLNSGGQNICKLRKEILNSGVNTFANYERKGKYITLADFDFLSPKYFKISLAFKYFGFEST
jgi:hypothetical protein